VYGKNGLGGCVCVLRYCTTASHRDKVLGKSLLKVRRWTYIPVLCISCTPEGGKQSAVFFLEPTLPSTRVSEEYLTSARPTGAWTTFFWSVLNQSDITSAEANELAERTRPPRKQKKPRWARNIEEPEEDVIIMLKPIPEDLGTTTEITVAVIREAWEPPLDNQSTLQDALADQTDAMHAVAKDLSSELEASELRTVGERTAESGTRSLFQPATAAEDELDGMLTKIDRLEQELRAALETSAEDTPRLFWPSSVGISRSTRRAFHCLVLLEGNSGKLT
jgi:hypothetical protein